MADQKLCYELKIVTPEENKDLLTALLIELGEQNFVEGAIDCDVEFDFDYEHFQRDYYGELAKDLPVIVYSEDEKYLHDLRKSVLEKATSFGLTLGEKDLSIGLIKDQNWRESWKASFKPVDVRGICIILPPWEDPSKFPHRYKIIIDPGMAFGTGQHETTRLCLDLFYDLPLPQTVIDVGTGSGILAIATRMAGSTRILGCDIDEPSIQIAAENGILNKTPDIEYTVTPIGEMSDFQYDLAFANIQFRPLVKIFDDILKRVKKDGKIIVSGILAVEFEDFKDFLSKLNVKVTRSEKLGDWVGFICERS